MQLDVPARDAAKNRELRTAGPSSPDVALVTAALIAGIGIYVLTGWAIGSEPMVRVLPNSVAMSVNAAILFVAVAICLSPTPQGAGPTHIRTAAACFLVALPAAILFEHWTDIDLGIDWAALHGTVRDDNPRPGRTAPNACVALLMTAVFFLLVDHRSTRTSRTLQTIVAVAVYGTLGIAVAGLAGYVLGLDALYRLGSSNRMAASTAISLLLAGIGMNTRLNRAPWRQDVASAGSAMRRIVKGSATVLTFVAIITGLTGFAMLKAGFDHARLESLQATTHDTASVVSNILEQHFHRARSVAESTTLRTGLADASHDPSGHADRQSLRVIGESLVASAFSHVAFFDAKGDEIASFGKPTNADPSAVAVAIDRGTTRGMLAWHDGFVLRTDEAVTDRGRIVGRLVAWQRLPAMTAVVEGLRLENDSTDVLICTREAGDAVCFPSRFYPKLQIPLIVDGEPNLAISHALLGQRGVMMVDDMRGKNVLAGYEPLVDDRLGIVVKTDSANLYAPMRDRLNLLAGWMVLIIGSGTLILRAYLKPLSRLLIERHLALEESEERLRVTLQSIGDAVITTDIDGDVSYLNPVAETMTGWRRDEAYGRPLGDVFHLVDVETGEPAPSPLEKVLQTRTAGALAKGTALVQRGGARFQIEDSAAPIVNSSGVVLGAVLVFHDVSHAHAMAAEMSHQAMHDPLTGLINRREFERRLQSSLQTAVRGNDHSLLYLDLDQFKIINDRCGHGAGDELLRQLTALLHDKLRRGDTLSRLGGDEFGVLLQGCGVAPAWWIAEGLRQTVSDFRFAWDDKTFGLGVSIGLVTFGDDGLTLSDVLRMADSACYVAKDKGRNRIQVYTSDDEELALRSGQMGWIGRIHKALEEERFELFSQRIVALHDESEQDSHYELLLRLRDENGDLVAPMAFIPAAERYGLMPTLDRWVISTAFAHFRTLHGAGAEGMCAINISANSICDETFASFLQDAFTTHRVPPRNICLEITETAAVTNLKQAMLFIRSLKAMGCRFALDDFGSGMSSFAHLKHLPVDFLKIDGAFVKDMADDPIDRAMVRSIHEIGHVMGLKTIAEFVENDAILAELKVIGVDFAQGYGIEKPRPAW